MALSKGSSPSQTYSGATAAARGEARIGVRLKYSGAGDNASQARLPRSGSNLTR